MHQILVYGDSLSWGIIPNSRERLPFHARWPGVMESALTNARTQVRVIDIASMDGGPSGRILSSPDVMDWRALNNGLK